MIANMEQQICRWQGNPVPLDSRGHHRHHRIIHILRILSTDRHSQRMVMSMISRKMDKADRGVSHSQTRRVSKGDGRREKIAFITTATLVRGGWHGTQESLFFFLVTTRLGMVFAFSQRTLHKLQSKAEVATESCEGKVAACFCQGYGYI